MDKGQKAQGGGDSLLKLPQTSSSPRSKARVPGAFQGQDLIVPYPSMLGQQALGFPEARNQDRGHGI